MPIPIWFIFLMCFLVGFLSGFIYETVRHRRAPRGKIIQYSHHGTKVKVDSKLKDKHRQHCLCWRPCKSFNPEDRANNCLIANELYELCQRWSLTTPVFECPLFEEETTK